MAFGVFRSIKKRLIESASRLTELRPQRSIRKRLIGKSNVAVKDDDAFEVVCGVAGCGVKKKEPMAPG